MGETETISGEEVTCREFIDFLSDYLDGALSPRVAEIFAAHLRICPDCANYLDSFRTVLQLERQAADQVAAPLPEALVRAILAARDPDEPQA